MTRPLRAADLGYVWPESIPDGRAWVKRRGLPILCENRPTREPARDWTIDGRVWSADECELLGIPIPDFGDRQWHRCILVKGDEPPELPPCPPGEGWVEWSGGECPISGPAEVQLQVGVVWTAAKAEGFNWVNGSIIRYRKPPKPKLRPYNAVEMRKLWLDGGVCQ